MKHPGIPRAVLTLAAALTVSGSANADFNLTFDSGPLSSEWSGAAMWTAGPVGWAGGGALQTTYTTAGWQNWTPTINFDWASGHQPDMQAMAAGGSSRVALDLLVDGSTFAPGVSDWYNVSLAANSANGWKQFDNVLGAGPWHNAGDNALYVTHIDKSFTDLGWTAGASWFQLNFAANSGASPLHFYVDNLNVYTVPEPGTLVLAGLGALALLRLRRK
jgi:hypothetical protein